MSEHNHPREPTTVTGSVTHEKLREECIKNKWVYREVVEMGVIKVFGGETCKKCLLEHATNYKCEPLHDLNIKDDVSFPE